MDWPVIAHVGLAALGAVIGGTFADIDLAPPLPLHHRSAWTHGPFIPMALPWLIAWQPLAVWFALGFLPAFAMHLLADMFPKKWHGGALIKLFPLPGALPALLSFIYLALGVAASAKTFLALWGAV